LQFQFCAAHAGQDDCDSNQSDKEIAMSAVTINKLGDSIGAEVLGVSRLRIQSDRTLPAACMEALDECGVLVFRELSIDDATQIAFSQALDDVAKPEQAQAPNIFKVTLNPKINPAADYLRGTFHWHIDGAQDEVPTKATVLSARVISASGGETEFASTYAAYDDLSDSEKAQMMDLRVIHSFEKAQRMVTPNPAPEELARWKEKPDREHPLVWRHRSGRRSLVIGASASKVVGMDDDSGSTLLANLIARATTPDRVYQHKWAVGDLVIWDNTGVMHRACPYDPNSARELHRTTMSGDEPIR
jgi:alpha-ketoglutarate-dependent taurine dioxygenase